METTQILLSKGIYSLLKQQLKTNRKLSAFNQQQLTRELKDAQIMQGKQLPPDVVCINSSVRVRDLETQEVLSFDVVAPSDAKVKNNKISVLSPIGLALVGYSEGQQVKWEMPEGMKTYLIETVTEL